MCRGYCQEEEAGVWEGDGAVTEAGAHDPERVPSEAAIKCIGTNWSSSSLYVGKGCEAGAMSGQAPFD